MTLRTPFRVATEAATGAMIVADKVRITSAPTSGNETDSVLRVARSAPAALPEEAIVRSSVEATSATAEFLGSGHRLPEAHPAAAPPTRQRSTQQYIQLARPLLVKRLLTQLDRIAAHAGTPEAGVYVYNLEHLVAAAMEQFFDDGFLSLLLAVRNVLAGENAWMRLSMEQIYGIQDLVRRYADKPFDNGLIFRRAVLELRKLGLETSPVELSEELWGDGET